jgi:hypothetical protein
MKRGDTAPALRATLTDDGTPIDLTPATVKVIGKRNGVAVFSRPATSKNSSGVATMTWQTADTALPGLIAIEFELTWPDSTVQTLPANGYLSVLIDQDLG